MSNRTGERGFTLVELLVALTLTAFLATLILGTLRLAAQVWSKADDRANAAADMQAVDNVLRGALGGAYPAYASADPNDRTVAFDGGAAALALVAPLPQAIGTGIPARLRFFLAGQGPSQALVMGWRLDLPASDPGTTLPENRRTLLAHVRAIRFAYFGADAAGGAPVWRRQWFGRDRLPDLVAVRIEPDDPAVPDWPLITVEPKAAMNSACLYDAATLDCLRAR